MPPTIISVHFSPAKFLYERSQSPSRNSLWTLTEFSLFRINWISSSKTCTGEMLPLLLRLISSHPSLPLNSRSFSCDAHKKIWGSILGGKFILRYGTGNRIFGLLWAVWEAIRSISRSWEFLLFLLWEMRRCKGYDWLGALSIIVWSRFVEDSRGLSQWIPIFKSVLEVIGYGR